MSRSQINFFKRLFLLKEPPIRFKEFNGNFFTFDIFKISGDTCKLPWHNVT